MEVEESRRGRTFERSILALETVMVGGRSCSFLGSGEQ